MANGKWQEWAMERMRELKAKLGGGNFRAKHQWELAGGP
jgi:hypothetical protein